MRERVLVWGGVAAGLLVALWFSTVVAMGPPSGSVQQAGQRKQAQSNQSNAATNRQRASSAGENQKPAGKEAECSNPSQSNYYDCLIQLRTARATERQVIAAEDQAHYAKIAAWVAAVALFAAAVAAAAGIWTVVVMRRTAIAQLRAYVTAKPSNIEFSGRIPMKIHMVAKNTGQTPAYNLVMLNRFEMLPYPLPAGFDFGPDPPVTETSNVLAADDTLPGDRPLGRPMGPQREAQLQAGTHRWYALGIVRYRDAFGYRRTTRYCASAPGDQLLRGMGIAAGGACDIQWEYTLVHNDAD